MEKNFEVAVVVQKRVRFELRLGRGSNQETIRCASQLKSLAEILTFNSVGTLLFFLGCNQDNIGGSNFIFKKKICLVLPEKEISNHRN